MKSKLTAAMLILATGLLGGCAYDSLIVDKDYIPRRIVSNISHVKSGVYAPKNTTIIFRNRMEVRSDIVELQFFGQLAARERPPYNIYAGRRCHDCESNRSIYLHSAADGRMSKRMRRFRYPGRLFSHVDGALVEQSRAFYGDCLPGYSSSLIVWFIHTRLDRSDWEDFVELVEASGEVIQVHQLKDPAPSIEPTLKLVEANRCREIPTIQMSTEP